MTYQKGCICLALGVLIRRAAVFLLKSVKDRPKLVGTIMVYRISPPSAQPEYDPDANQRGTNVNESDT